MVVKHATTTIKRKKVIKKTPVVNTPKKVVKPKKEEEKNKGPALDEKGNPLPIENPEGGDPVCIGGFRIDYDFDILDPINPPFRCISALKDPSDSMAKKVMNNINNPSDNAIRLVVPSNPAAGGSRRKRKAFISSRRSIHRNRRLTRRKKI